MFLLLLFSFGHANLDSMLQEFRTDTFGIGGFVIRNKDDLLGGPIDSLVLYLRWTRW